jgi:uncharacterized protein
VAGVVGTAGGITSLVSYPALLALGLGPLPANVTNVVAVVACWPGSALASRPELVGTARWLRRWSVLAGAGGLAGCGLLLLTSRSAFAHIVPFLLVLASLALLLQPRLSRWHGGYEGRSRHFLLPCGLFLVSVYNGYFGAGAGVMVLALLLVTVETHVARANALKNMLLGVATVLSAVTYAVAAPVHWLAAAPLALGLFVGSLGGPWVARRVPASALRWLAALTGLGLAVHLWLAPG